MKGMLTGPVTILQWSLRARRPAAQRDLHGRSRWPSAMRCMISKRREFGIIQIDEPALREGLPLRRSRLAGLSATGRSTRFRLCAAGVRRRNANPHAHVLLRVQRYHRRRSRRSMPMSSPSKRRARRWSCSMPLSAFKYPNEIGPGVYDIHSPRVPEAAEMTSLLIKAESTWQRSSFGSIRTAGSRRADGRK